MDTPGAAELKPHQSDINEGSVYFSTYEEASRYVRSVRWTRPVVLPYGEEEIFKRWYVVGGWSPDGSVHYEKRSA